VDDEAEFDWADAEIVLREQQETAIYFNRDEGLVIRQQCWPDDDHYVIISKNNIDAFLDRLTDACGIPTFGGPPPKPAPRR
jgi:hypothetical protein